MHSLTLLRVKFHEPVSLLFLEAIKVFLEAIKVFQQLVGVFLRVNTAVQHTVISKKLSDGFWRYVLWEVVNVQKEQQWPRTLPCGTPDSTGEEVEDDPSSSTCWLRPSRKLLINLFRLFCIPSYLIFDSSRRCRTLSKALEKSRRIISVCPITSMVLARSCIVSRS